MDKILEFINKQTDNKYKNLLFFGGVFDKKSSAMQIEFSNLSKEQKTKENVEQLTVLCKQFLNGFVDKVVIKFHSNSLTMQEFKFFVQKTIVSREELHNVDTSKIDIDFCEDKTLVSINYPEGSINEAVLDFEKSEIEREIFEKLNQNVEICFKKNVTESSVLENRKDRLFEDNHIFEEMKKSQVVEIQNVEVLFGDFNCKKANLAGYFDYEENGDICSVGVVKACSIKEIKPKTSENTGNETDDESKQAEKPKKYMVFELEYDGLKTRAVWFMPKNFEDFEPIALDTTIAIYGKINEYAGERSVRVFSFAKCTFVEPNKVWRKCPTAYQHVKPEPYEFAEQTNLFFDDKKTENKYLLENTFVVYDLETTGINTNTCKIIDIGAYKIVDGKIVEKFCTFVNPECEIPEEASKVNRITNVMVENSPTIEMALPDFYKFCYGSIIVGYNNIGFDDLFILREGKKQYYNFDNKRDDVFNIAKSKIGGLRNYKLSTVCQYENVPLIDAHRASNDALATAKLFIKLVEKYC